MHEIKTGSYGSVHIKNATCEVAFNTDISWFPADLVQPQGRDHAGIWYGGYTLGAGVEITSLTW